VMQHPAVLAHRWKSGADPDISTDRKDRGPGAAIAA